MADDAEHQPDGTEHDSSTGPESRPPGRQAVLADVYERAALMRRRRAGWLGVGCGLAVLVAMAGVLSVVPDRGSRGVLTADLADSTSSAPVLTTGTLPSTTGTAFSTSPGTSTSDSTIVHHPTVVPDESVTTHPPDPGLSTVPETTIPDDGIVSITVSPERPMAGDPVTVTVHVVDDDTDLRLCGRDWGTDAAGPSPSCPTKTCGPGDPAAEAIPGSTDRTDTWNYTYEEPGAYAFRVEYRGDDCTTHADHHTASVTIEVG